MERTIVPIEPQRQGARGLTALALTDNKFGEPNLAPPGLALNQTTFDWMPTNLEKVD